MTDEQPTRDEQITGIARQFAAYLGEQTGTNLADPEDTGSDDLKEAFVRLDAALDQLTALADVYGADPRSAYEPLVLPAAALVGEYFRHGSGARWIEPVVDEDTTLIIESATGAQIDLTAAVRAAFLSGMPNLSVMASQILALETTSDE